MTRTTTPLALVTGAAGGIGRAIANRLASDGYQVMALDKDDLDLAQVARDGVPATLRERIGERLDVLVNNAAVQHLAGTSAITPEAWADTLAVNLTAPFRLVQDLLPALNAAHGRVVNITSIHARLTKPGFAAYATSKAALEGLTRALAVDLAPAVRVNAVAPAAVETPMLRAGFEGRPDALAKLASYHPAGRLGRPEEIADAVAFLASPSCGFATGATLEITGGIGARLHDP